MAISGGAHGGGIKGVSANTAYISYPTTATGTTTTIGTGGQIFGPSTNIYNPLGVVTDKPKYSVFELPLKNKMPNKVYVNGILLTVGILGSDVQAAFAGDKIIFSPGEIPGIADWNKRLTVSLDYGDSLYHYNIITDDRCIVEFKEGSNIIKAKLVSKVAQK